jgi:hypothetical protein
MTYAISNHFGGMNDAKHGQAGGTFDAWLIDEEFDDALDSELASFREMLADSRHS